MVDAYEIRNLALAGHSEGGANATAFAGDFPDIVTSLLVLENAHDLNFAAMATSAPPAAIKTPIGKNFASWEDAHDWQRSHLPNVSEQVIDRRLYSRLIERNGVIEWREDLRIFPYKTAHPQTATDRLEPIKQLQCRTLFLLASDSNLVSDEAADIAVSAVSDAMWKRVPNTGHNLHEDNLEDTLAAVTEFLSGDAHKSS